LTVIRAGIAVGQWPERCAARAQLNVIGPSQIAAQLEGSKISPSIFCSAIRSNRELYGEFSAPAEAYAALADVPYPIVVKADGLCAAKESCWRSRQAKPRIHYPSHADSGICAGGKQVMLEETLEGDELFHHCHRRRKICGLAANAGPQESLGRRSRAKHRRHGAYSTDALMSPELANGDRRNDC